MDSIFLKKINKISGTLKLPGSKSMTNRALLLAALAKGECKIHNYLLSEDTNAMLSCLDTLNVKYQITDEYIYIIGNDGPFKTNKSVVLDLKNAGTAFRPLCAILAISEGEFIIKGQDRLYQRPIKPLVDALRELGLCIEYLDKEGFAPLKIIGQKLISNITNIDASLSSQFLTALLMLSGLTDKLQINLKGKLISRPYIDLTLSLLERFSHKLENINYQEFISHGKGYISPQDLYIEGDASGATYFMAAAAIAGEVNIYGIGKNSTQGDIKFAHILKDMGACVEFYDDHIHVKKDKPLQGFELDLNDIPDAAMTFVPMALYTNGPIYIKNIGSWKDKECNRIEALKTQMEKIGCTIEATEDSFFIQANNLNDHIPVFETYNDHRMAMCLSLVSFNRDINILDPNCTYKTYPRYFQTLNELIA